MYRAARSSYKAGPGATQDRIGLSAALKNTATRAQHGGFAGRSALSQRLARPTTPLGTENDCPAVGVVSRKWWKLDGGVISG